MLKKRWSWLPALIFVSCAGGGSKDKPTKGDDATPPPNNGASASVDLLAGIRREVLPNGLVVIIKEDHRVPIVSTALGYKVGSVNESKDDTGLSHYLEHMLFKGTDKYQRGEIDLITMKAGGANNAYTSNDMTVYWFQFHSDCLDEFLAIESNRMTNCTMDVREFEAEKKVVEEELNRDLDSPWGPLEQEMEKTVFTTSGYHHPVLGWRAHLDKMTRDTMVAYYRSYYQPDNAILVVVGDVKTEECLEKIRRMFGPLPAAKKFPGARGSEPAQDGERRFQLETDDVTARLLMGFRSDVVGSRADIALDLLSTILSNGKKSRLNVRLVEKDDLVAEGGVGTSNYTRKYDGVFYVQAEMKPGAKAEDAEKAIHEELALLQTKPVTDDELKRAKNILKAGFAFGKETSIDLATSIVQFEILGLPNYLREYMDRVQALTAKDLMEVAKTVFDPKRRSVGVSKPKKGGEKGYLRIAPRTRAARSVPRVGGGGLDVGEFWQVRLDNGLTILLKRKAGVPVVSLEAYVRAGAVFDAEDKAGVSNLVGELLDEGVWDPSARRRLTYEQIAEMIENVGGQLGTGSTGVEVKVLSEHREIAYDLARDLLLFASFPDDRLKQVQEDTIAAIEASNDDPRSVARRLFYETVYKGHPLHRPGVGYKETVEKLTREDAVAHYKRFFRPDNTILAVVGDIDPVKTIAELRMRFDGWKAEGPLDLPAIPAIARQTEPRAVYEYRKKLQVNVYIGHVSIDRFNPDYAVLEVMQNILCTGAGFTDRLSKNVRDIAGLAYAVGGTITGGASEIPCPFIVYVGTEAEKKDKALSITMTEIRKFIEEGPTDEEVASAKQYLVRNFPFHFETGSSLASYLIQLRRFNLAPDDARRFVASVNAVTKEDLKRAAQKYLDVKNYSLVIVGPVDKDGNVIKTDKEK